MRDYLIYTSAGRAANVKQWYLSSNKNYDIWVTNYTDSNLLNKGYSDYYNERKGSKFQNLKAVFEKDRELLSHYKAIMVLDDDIIISPNSLSELFNTLINKDLWMLHPAFSRYGKISHKITERKLLSDLRYTNFVEIGCPIFRTDKLFDFLNVYDPEISSCYGLDYWFSHHFGIDNQNKYGISDRYFCTNPYEYFKACDTREIDTLNSPEERILMWQKIKRKIGINEFQFREYHKIQRSLNETIWAIPGFALEMLISKTVKKIFEIRGHKRIRFLFLTWQRLFKSSPLRNCK